jgi:alanine racemase
VKSWIEISEAALRENFRAAQEIAGVEADVLPVIKANGYGHGAELIAPVLAEAGARWLGVADVDEGVRVRRALKRRAVRLLAMSGMEPGDAQVMVERGITPVVWTVGHLKALSAEVGVHPSEHRTFGGDLGAKDRVKVHLEIDSGMARQGAAPGAELAGFLEELKRLRKIELEGLMSHLSSAEVAEVAESAMTERQRDRFSEAIAQVVAAGVRPRVLHLANSSAVDEGSTMEWVRETAAAIGARVMVRPGLATYGYCLPIEGRAGDSGYAGALAARLRPVLAWKTKILATRFVAPGQTVGYGATFVAERRMRLALLPVGYSDGFRREASSGVGDGWVMIAGERAAVVGRVSMNLTMVDVSGISAAREGTEVTLLGEGVTADDHARWCGTISYEILCGIRAEARMV